MILPRQKIYSFGSFLSKINKTLTPKYKIKEEEERKAAEEIESKLPPEYKKVKALEDELGKIYPGLGDGDEYMNVSTNPYIEDSEPDIIQMVIYTPQRLQYNYDTKNKCWIDEGFDAYVARKSGRRVTFSQIKKALLDEVNDDINDWKKNLYWEDDENEKVIAFLEEEKKLIQTRL